MGRQPGDHLRQDVGEQHVTRAQEQHVTTLRPCNTFIHRVVDAAIRLRLPAQATVPTRLSLGQILHRAIGGTPIYDHNLQHGITLMAQRIQGALYALTRVEARNNKRNRGTRGKIGHNKRSSLE